jgi:hypothetical protein
LTAESDEAKSEADNAGKVGDEDDNRTVTLLHRMMSAASLAKQQRLEKGRAAEELNKDEDWVPREARAWPVSEAVRLDNELKKAAGMSLRLERVLFIGTHFSILYTSMYSPAETATHTVDIKESRGRERRAVRAVSAIYRRPGEEYTGCMVWKTRGRSFLSDGYVPTESAPETNMILGATWNIRAQLAIEAAEDLRNDGRATYVSRELDQSGQVVKEGECWELQKGKEGLLLAFKEQFGQEAEVEVPMNPDAVNVITVMEGEDIGALGAWGRAMSKAVGTGDVYEMNREALHEKGIPVDSVESACSVTAGNMNRLERIMHAMVGEEGKGSLGSYPDLVGSKEATHLNCDPHTIASKYKVKLTENNIAAIWVYKMPEIEIKVTAGGVTLRMPVKLRVTGAGQARVFVGGTCGSVHVQTLNNNLKELGVIESKRNTIRRGLVHELLNAQDTVLCSYFAQRSGALGEGRSRESTVGEVFQGLDHFE